MYKDVDKKEELPGIKFWQNDGNRFHVLMLHYRSDPNKDPDRDGQEWYDHEREGTPKAVWEKEYEIDFETKSGKLVYGPEYCDFNAKTHLINSFDLGEVELFMAMDFGQRNPNCVLIGALTPNNKVYIIDEYYNPAIPSVASREMFSKFGYLMPGYNDNMTIRLKKQLADETFQVKVIDPSTAHKNRTKIIEGEEREYSVIEDFEDNGWEFEKAHNDWDAGVTRVREYLAMDKEGNSSLYIFADKCPMLAWELQRYKYKENTEKTDRQNNEPEKPVKKDDHGCFTGDSLVNTVNGDIQIKDLVGEEGFVYSYDEKKKRITAKRFYNVVKTGTKKTIKITLDDGSELKCTEDHPILLRGGDYIEAKNIKEGDSLMPLHRNIDSHGHTMVYLNNGDKMFAHRLVYNDCISELPEDSWKWNIHHKDEDKLNNNPENLQLMSRADHCAHHARNREITDKTKIKLRAASTRKWQDEKFRKKQLVHLDNIRDLTKEWHSSEAGLKWHSKHGHDSWTEEKREKKRKDKNCRECGEEFTTEDGTGEYCHANCKASYNRRKRREKFGMTDKKRAELKKEGKFNHKVVKIVDWKTEDVYNMQVEDTHNFACEGVIVHNCDALRYLLMTRPTQPKEQPVKLNRVQRDIQKLLRPKTDNLMSDFDAY